MRARSNSWGNDGVSAELLSQSPIPPGDVEGSSRKASHGNVAELVPPSPMLSKHHFLRQMRLEKRRTERSKAPLSLVLFMIDIEQADGIGVVNALADLLRTTKRETDVLGYLSEDCLALLLPHTNEQGTQSYTRNLRKAAGHLTYSTIVGTYPDHVFESLMEGNQIVPETSPIFIDHSIERNEVGAFFKRILDIVGSISLIIVASPIMVITAIALKVTSREPVIFKQPRLGKRGVPFEIYKFRSMSTNADDRIHREYVTKLIQGDVAEINQGDASKPIYKLTTDPRITPIGRVIRKTSIDELPQLFNVLNGDMSLVGPRPPVRYEAERYQIWHLRRILEVRPGITGLWQVMGRSSTSFDEMVRLDLRYIREWSFWLDLKILLKTVKVVLLGSGGM
jgi:exopolysaccharide biosynthesis polyprenyl glycosylphosphotransferase